VADVTATDPGASRRRDDLEAVLTHVTDLSELLLVLDFDGTLSPIVDDPDAAAPAAGALEAVAALTDRAAVAVLSGRHLDDLAPRVGALPVILVGGHGTEVRDPDGTRTSLFDAGPVQQVLDECADELGALLAGADGWRVERKPASLAVHHRTAAPADVARLLERVRAVLAAPAADGAFDVLDGKMVTELRPSGVDKGTALRWLADRHPDRRVLVLGDDVTDEDAFAAAADLGGNAVLVSTTPRRTAARWRIDDPTRVVLLLERLGAPGTAAPLGAEQVWTRRFHPIAEHGMIGDSRTAALVAPDASVEWMCIPRFDSPSIFAAILDPVRGGRFRVRPTRPLEVQRTYLGETNVLVTRFVDAGSPVLTVTDLLVTSRVNAFDARHTGHHLLRKVEVFGDVEVEVVFQPRFDYARVPTHLEVTQDGVVATADTSDGPQRALLVSDLPFAVTTHEGGNGDVATARLGLTAGAVHWLSLRTGDWERSPHLHLSPDELLDLTVRTWGRWARAIEYDGPWRDDVVRSALVLKGLVYEPTGALVAAPTTSLPEGLGGVRNWDYRYAWIRDSAYVLECFLRIGHTREAETFIRWLGELSERIGGAHALRPLYRIDGEDDLVEFELDHLDGYHDSRPVRIGNGAATQLQLDIYGAAMQLGWLTEQAGTEVPTTRWPTIVELVEAVAERWDEPDAGLWEIRSEPKHHTFSKFQCWLAVDRAIRIGEDLGLAGPYDRWRRVAADIRDSIMTHGYDEELGAFTQAYGEPHMDASLLLLPLKGFIAPTDPRVRSTVEAIRRELEVGDGLLLRYRTVDGLDGHEGAFLLCSFWLVELLARMGDLEEAVRLFERLRAAAGPLGLYAEELDPVTHLHLGNFPQAFTHMGLIGAATAIHEELSTRPLTGRG
jgi:trehalose 6-phosphate phosphatase